MSLAPMPITKISEEDFFAEYEPREFPDGSIIIDFHATRQFPLNHIWSIVESDRNEDLFAEPGVRIVNCVGFIVCEKPWTDENLQAVWFKYDEDFEYLEPATDMAYYDGSM